MKGNERALFIATQEVRYIVLSMNALLKREKEMQNKANFIDSPLQPLLHRNKEAEKILLSPNTKIRIFLSFVLHVVSVIRST